MSLNIQTFSGKVQVNDNLKVGQGHLFVDTAQNQVGVNTATPVANLHVFGNTFVHNDLRVGSGIVMDQKVATFGTTKTFVVEVVGGVFEIDGVSRPALTFHESQSYIFDQSHTSNGGHPIAFSEAVNGGTPYTTGVTSTGTPGQAGAQTLFKVPVGAPSTLYYYCTQHPTTMGSLSSAPSVVSTDAEIIVSGRLLASSFHGDGANLNNIPASAINGTLSQWVTTGNDIYYSTGGVAIGSSQAPTSTLDVTGSGAFSTTLSVGGSGAFGGDLTVGTDKLFVDVSTGQVGVGTATPAAGKALHVVGDFQATYLYGDGSNISNITSSQWVTTGTDIYYDTGSVAIGSSQAPTSTLDVTGTGAFSDDVTVGTSKLVVDVSASRVGVNKAAPGYTLDVDGDINFTGDIRKAGVVQSFGGGGSGSGGGGVWTEVTGTTQIHYSTGNVGVANSNPQHTLSVGSNLYVEDAGSNVLVVDGNVACNQITLGQFEIVPSYGLDDVVNESNTTTKTVHLSNVTTGFITTSNALVGGEFTVTGNVIASSNITVTGNVVVDDDLYFTSNAKLHVDSNVIVEHAGPHAREPKTVPLKKYPEIVFDDTSKMDMGQGGTTNGLLFKQAGYTITASSTHSSNGRVPYLAFNGDHATGWICASSSWNSTTNEYQGGRGIGEYSGEWIKLELPQKIKVETMYIEADLNSVRRPLTGKLLGSDDDSTWTIIKDFTSIPNQDRNNLNVGSTVAYKYIAFLTETVSGGDTVWIDEIEYYGYEEDPPAGDTSIDTTFKSVLNTPQTTGANVYVDAKLSSGFTNQVTGPTPVGTAATHDNTNKYWELTGELTSNITVEANTFLEGDQPHAVSVWFNSSNLEANVSNTCVFSVASEEKLDSVNLDLQSNTWHNLTYAYQGEGGSRVTYLDGRKVSEDQAEDTFGDYPPFAMTGYSQGGYVVSASSEYIPTPQYRAWEAFNDITASDYDNWTSGDFYAANGGDGTRSTVTWSGSTNHNGEFIKLELPHKLIVNYVKFEGRQGSGVERQLPRAFTIIGSNDEVNWETIHQETRTTNPSTGETHVMTGVSKHKGFKYIALVPKNSGTTNTNTHISIGNISYYGHRENDLVRLPDPTNVLEYPHITMTGFAQRGYEVSASSTYTPDYKAWKMFADDDASNPSPYGGYGWWLSPQNKYRTSTPFEYLGGTADNLGTYTGSSTATDNGVWVQLKMPHKILLSSVFLGNGAWHETAPGSFKFYGTNNDQDWTLIKSFTGQNPQGGSSFTINATVAYRTIGLVITHCAGANSYGSTGISEMKFYGTGVDSIPIQVGGGNIDKVANFRVYDRFIEEDQALEIWDAQKDEFGRAKSSMTLQKGRLGLGTEEPEGRLAVLDEPHNLEEFPPRAMSDYKTYFEGHGEFCASASSKYFASGATVATYVAYQGFDRKVKTASNGWSGITWNSVSPSYDNSTGIVSTDASLGGYAGEWLKLSLPYGVKISGYQLAIRSAWVNYGPDNWVILGSNDDKNWDLVSRVTAGHITQGTNGDEVMTKDFSVETTKYYKYLALVCSKVAGPVDQVNFSELRYFGTREQGQSILHDGQLTLTKSLNVPRIGPPLDADDTPRRDRLVVEYNTSTNPTFEGAVRDTSGWGNDGMFHGGASYSATEKALVFDGNADYVESPPLGWSGAQQHSVSVWIKLDLMTNPNSTSIQNAWTIVNGGAANRVSHLHIFYNGTIEWAFNGNNATTGSGQIQAGSWYHIACVYNGGAGDGATSRRMWINGDEKSWNSLGSSDTLNLEPEATFALGYNKQLNNYDHDGSVSNAKLYDVALTAEEVKTLYDMGRCDEGHHTTMVSRSQLRMGGENLRIEPHRGIGGFYEEGTWVPIIHGSTSGKKTPSSANKGWWVRVGNLVTIGGTVHWDGGDTISGMVKIGYLPYKSNSATDYRAAMNFGVSPTTGGGITTTNAHNTMRLVLDPGQDGMYLIVSNEYRSTTLSYSHNPGIGASGYIYGVGGTYMI